MSTRSQRRYVWCAPATLCPFIRYLSIIMCDVWHAMTVRNDLGLIACGMRNTCDWYFLLFLQSSTIMMALRVTATARENIMVLRPRKEIMLNETRVASLESTGAQQRGVCFHVAQQRGVCFHVCMLRVPLLCARRWCCVCCMCSC
jgi:hypothetical protein